MRESYLAGLEECIKDIQEGGSMHEIAEYLSLLAWEMEIFWEHKMSAKYDVIRYCVGFA